MPIFIQICKLNKRTRKLFQTSLIKPENPCGVKVSCLWGSQCRVTKCHTVTWASKTVKEAQTARPGIFTPVQTPWKGGSQSKDPQCHPRGL